MALYSAYFLTLFLLPYLAKILATLERWHYLLRTFSAFSLFLDIFQIMAPYFTYFSKFLLTHWFMLSVKVPALPKNDASDLPIAVVYQLSVTYLRSKYPLIAKLWHHYLRTLRIFLFLAPFFTYFTDFFILSFIFYQSFLVRKPAPDFISPKNSTIIYVLFGFLPVQNPCHQKWHYFLRTFLCDFFNDCCSR